MTTVAFHSGVPDLLGYTCRLLRKAVRQGSRVAVVGDPAVLDRLDQSLWVFEQEEFLPHLRLRGGAQAPSQPNAQPNAQMARTPIWLLDDLTTDVQATVLVNLGLEPDAEMTRYERVIEVVASDEDAVQSGRWRWRQWAALGVAPTNLPYKPAAAA